MATSNLPNCSFPSTKGPVLPLLFSWRFVRRLDEDDSPCCVMCTSCQSITTTPERGVDDNLGGLGTRISKRRNLIRNLIFGFALAYVEDMISE